MREVTSPVVNQAKLMYGTLPEQLREMERILKTNIEPLLWIPGAQHTLNNLTIRMRHCAN